MSIMSYTQPPSPQYDATGYKHLFVDAEWFQETLGKPVTFLTKQFTFTDDKFRPVMTLVLWNENFSSPKNLEMMSRKMGHEIHLITGNIQDKTLLDIADLADKLTLYLYYAPKDVEAAIGRDVWREAIIAKGQPVKKLRNITGKLTIGKTTIKIQDVLGAFNTSLDKAMESVGVVNPYKHLATQGSRTKDRMDKFMRENPDEFLSYALGDTVYLGATIRRRAKLVNSILKSALDIPSDIMVPEFDPSDPCEADQPVTGLYSLENFPYSSGSLVARTFEAWLTEQHPKLMKKALGLTACNSNKLWGQLRDAKKALDDVNDVEGLKQLNRKLRGSQYIHGLSMGGIRNYALLTRNTGLYGSVVMGGRCVNEEPKVHPYEARIENVIDPDLSSCYGNALRDLDYPLGIPTIFERGQDDNDISLGEFLKRYESELVDGLYTIYVSGKLGFDQDLIHSKYELSTAKILKTLTAENFEPETDTEIWGREIETAHIGGNFLLTLNEIESGIITSDVLKTLKAVCSNQEWAGFKSLKVVCAIYYPRSLEVDNDTWAELPVGTVTAKGDRRGREWTRVPLEGFVGAFVKQRKAYKDLAKKAKRIAASLPKEDPKAVEARTVADMYDILQNAVKLFVNTTYGDLAAPYFPMGNTVLANNITAKARVGVWMMSKALLTVQSITDGGMFSADRVAVLKGSKRPSMHVLSDRERLLSHRAIVKTPLVRFQVIDWVRDMASKGFEKETEEQLNNLCMDHVNSFWANYGLKLPFAIEVKLDNTARKAVYFGSSDYLMYDCFNSGLNRDGAPYAIKVRGAKQEDHPKKLWLWHLLDPQRYPLPNPHFVYRQMIGFNEFQKSPDSFGELMPGDDVQRDFRHRPYTNGERYKTYKDWKRTQDAKRKAENRADKEDTVGLFGLAKALSANPQVQPRTP